MGLNTTAGENGRWRDDTTSPPWPYPKAYRPLFSQHRIRGTYYPTPSLTVMQANVRLQGAMLEIPSPTQVAGGWLWTKLFVCLEKDRHFLPEVSSQDGSKVTVPAASKERISKKRDALEIDTGNTSWGCKSRPHMSLSISAGSRSNLWVASALGRLQGTLLLVIVPAVWGRGCNYPTSTRAAFPEG